MTIKPWQQELTYLHGKPSSTAVIRTQPEDFQVYEELGFEPDGEGEHVFLYIRKTGENTDWVARQLAHFCQLSPRDVSYAGKKDRHAVTEQWFSVQLPMHRNINWDLFGGDTIQVLKAVRHGRKLRKGTLKGNRFVLRLRDVTDGEALEQRCQKVANSGVPNYFGEQRFGFEFGNIDKGIALLKGELKERQRNKKGMYISAVRSWLFNHLLDQRLEQGLWDTLLEGDVLMLAGSQSCFVNDGDSSIATRLAAADVNLTGPMWGRGRLMTTGAAAEFEQAALADSADIAALLENVGLNQERRALRLNPVGLALTAESGQQWQLEFSLPAGTFATSVLRELCIWQQPNDH